MMTSQQINLAKGLEPTESKWMSAKHLFLLLFGLITCLLLVSLVQWGSLFFQYAENTALKKENEALKEEFTTLVMQYPVLAKYKSIPNAIGGLRVNYRNYQNYYLQLSKEDLQVGYAPFLDMLSKLISPQVSLQEIIFSKQKRSIKILGIAEKAQDVATMVDTMSQQPLFKGYILGRYLINQQPNKVTFEIASIEKAVMDTESKKQANSSNESMYQGTMK